MKLSEVFRRAAEELPSDRVYGMCYAISDVILKLADGISLYSDTFKKIKLMEYNANYILNTFRPPEVNEHAPWIVAKDKGLDCDSMHQIVVNTIEEAQQWRKNILLKCAEVAESEGL